MPSFNVIYSFLRPVTTKTPMNFYKRRRRRSDTFSQEIGICLFKYASHGSLFCRKTPLIRDRARRRMGRWKHSHQTTARSFLKKILLFILVMCKRRSFKKLLRHPLHNANITRRMIYSPFPFLLLKWTPPQIHLSFLLFLLYLMHFISCHPSHSPVH